MEDLQDFGLGAGAELLGLLGPGQAGAEDEEEDEGRGSRGSVSVFVSANRDDRGRAGTGWNLIIRGESSLMGG